MDITKLSGSTLIVVTKDDLLSYADRIASQIRSIRAEPTLKPEPEQPIPQAQALKDFHLSRQTFLAYRKKGIIKAYTLGGRVYFLRSELMAALKSQSK